MKVFIFLSLFVLTVHAKRCCKPESISLKSVDTCEDDQEISLICPPNEKRLQLLAPNVTNESILDDDVENVCHGTLKNQSGIYPILTVCRDVDYEIWNEEVTILLYIAYFFHIISFGGSLLTTFIYFRLPRLQDVHGTCTYHLSLHLAMFHGLVVYKTTFDTPFSLKSEKICIANAYILAYLTIATLLWSCILSYNTWRLHRPQTWNKDRLANICRLIGYGVPLILILAAYLHTHLTSIHQKSELETNCNTHITMVISWYVFLCAITMPIINFYFFLDSRCYLWRIAKTQPYKKSFINKLRFRISLNLKLFFIMNFPLMISQFSLVLSYLAFPFGHLKLLTFLLVGLPAAQGLLVFLVLVVLRKRVMKELVDPIRRIWSFGRVPDQSNKTENAQKTEESIDTDEEEITLQNLRRPY